MCAYNYHLPVPCVHHTPTHMTSEVLSSKMRVCVCVLGSRPRVMRWPSRITLNIYCALKPDSIKTNNGLFLSSGMKTTPDYDAVRRARRKTLRRILSWKRGPECSRKALVPSWLYCHGRWRFIYNGYKTLYRLSRRHTNIRFLTLSHSKNCVLSLFLL